MASVRFTDADRDTRGFVKANPEPRSLADLLPVVEPIQQRRAPQPWSRREMAGLATVALCAIAVIAWAWATPTARLDTQRTPVPTTALAPTVPVVVPQQPPVSMLAVYSAPDRELGTIEATRAMTVTAHHGTNWIQADVAGSGLVWLRASDVPDLALSGPDLAPKPTAVYVAPAPIPAAAPAPAVRQNCAEAGLPGMMVRVCGEGDLAARAQAEWVSTYGGNVGVVITPSPRSTYERLPNE